VAVGGKLSEQLVLHRGAEGVAPLYPQQPTASYNNLWNVASLLLQKMPAPSFSATVKLEFIPHSRGEKAGLIIFGMDYASITIEKSNEGYRVVQTICTKAEKDRRRWQSHLHLFPPQPCSFV